MQKILVISGKKQSGKTSLCNFLYGLKMREKGIIKAFDINNEGDLLVNTSIIDQSGKQTEGVGKFDIERKSPDFIEYCHNIVWPHIKLYSFADELKLFLIRHFGLTVEQCYGTNEQKETNTVLRWCDFNFVLPVKTISALKKEGKYNSYMKAREVMQIFGTDICRRIFSPCWAKPVLESIMVEGSGLAIVSDARFISEIELSREFGAKTVRLTRHKYKDGHSSENELDEYDGFDAVIDNKDMSIREKNESMYMLLKEWGWVEGEL
jgi:hypothetical protein